MNHPVHATAVLESGFTAWATDMHERESAVHLPQVAIIPLAAVWKAVMRREEPARDTVRDFAVDVIASQVARTALESELTGEAALLFRLDRSIKIPKLPAAGPYAYERVAIISGRNPEEVMAESRELAIAGLVAHAAYNSTSGGRMLSIDPFGPHPAEPGLWKTLGYEHSVAFVEGLPA